MEASGDAAIDSLALDLATILAPNSRFSKAKQSLDESVENMMAKLEEFSCLIEMVSSLFGAAVGESVPRAFLARQQLQQLFGRIDAMSSFVQLVDTQLHQLEASMDACERRMNASRWTGAFSALLRLKRNEDRWDAVMPAPCVEIFNVNDYFHQRLPPVTEED